MELLVEAAPQRDSSSMDAELHGAFVVDPRGSSARANDRVLVIGLWTKARLLNGLVQRNSLLRFTLSSPEPLVFANLSGEPPPT